MKRRVIRQPIVGTCLQFLERPVDEGERIAVTNAHTFGRARRTRGVEDIGEIVVIGLRIDRDRRGADAGEVVLLEPAGMRMEIVASTDRRVNRLRVSRLAPAS